MREKLFRGKRIDNGEWVYGYYVFRRKRRGIFGQTITELDFDTHYIVSVRGESFEIDPTTVGQCVSDLPDKNGKKIFEGDIVSGFFNHEKIVGYIFYGSDASFFIQRDGLLGIGLNNASDWLEIIGNIHDNPDLLEDKL